MSQAGRRRTAAEWRRLLRELDQSGQSPAAFARARGIRLGTLKWWRWRLDRETKGALARRDERRVQLVAVHPAPEYLPTEQTTVRPVWELLAPTGHELRVYDPRGLATLKTALFAITRGRRR